MSLATQVQSAITRIGTEFKSVRATIGDMATLTTTAKGNLVAAINEVKAATASATGINDATTTTTTTWSSSKINTAINAVSVAWANISGKPTTFAPIVGTTATTAKAGNWFPTWTEVTAKPTFATVATSGSAADLTGILPTSALPPLAISDVNVVASQAAMLALTAQQGDMAIRTDVSKTFVLATDSPTTLADWKEISAGGTVQSVAGKTGTVTLVKADVGLSNVDNTSDAAKPISTATQTALNTKASIGTVAGTAADAAAVGDTNTDFVATFEAGLV